jgi:signal transduction histidine kinase
LQTQVWPWAVTTSHDARLVVACSFVIAAAAVLGRWYLRTAFGARIEPAPFWRSAAWRGACFATIILGLAVAFPNGQIGAGVAVGVLAGADLQLTLWALGTAPQIGVLVRLFVLSPVHLGAIGAALAVLITDTGPGVAALGGLYLGVISAFVTTLLVVGLLGSLALHFEREYEAHRLDVAARERAHRAHWLHDDVLSEVRLASLRITTGTANREQIHAELLDLDHRLRMRQLDELIRGGNPPVYEILQPHLRRAQSLGMRLVDVPTHEVTGTVLTEDEAALLHRVLSLLTSNAINAGATELSVGLRLPAGALEVSVTDDAGGFDLAAVPEGRGLHRLVTDLAPGSVWREDAPGGSTVSVRMPREGADAVGEPAPADHRVPRPAARTSA